jgi:hypothetical protein
MHRSACVPVGFNSRGNGTPIQSKGFGKVPDDAVIVGSIQPRKSGNPAGRPRGSRNRVVQTIVDLTQRALKAPAQRIWSG